MEAMQGRISSIRATEVNPREIVLTSEEDIQKVYKAILNNDNFVLKWIEKGEERAQLIVASKEPTSCREHTEQTKAA